VCRDASQKRLNVVRSGAAPAENTGTVTAGCPARTSVGLPELSYYTLTASSRTVPTTPSCPLAFLPRANFANHLVQRPSMKYGPINEFAVNIIWQDNLLNRTRFLFGPFDQPWSPFLEEMKDLRRYFYNVLIHM
jgi:hypothetical protein